MQLNLDFTTRQNSAENQSLYDGNKHKFGRHCQLIYDYLMQGNHATRAELEQRFGIGDARARIRDLRNGGINIQDYKQTVNNSTFKIYYIQQP